MNSSGLRRGGEKNDSAKLYSFFIQAPLKLFNHTCFQGSLRKFELKFSLTWSFKH